MEILPVPLNWKPVQINSHFKVKFGISKIDTRLTMQGEKLCELVSDDGRKIRLKPEDFTSEQWKKVFKVIRAEFGLKKGQKGTYENTKT